MPHGRMEKWPGMHCLRMREKPHEGIVYHRLRTVSSEARPSQAYPANTASKSNDFDKALKFALCWIGKALKAEQLDAIKGIHDGKDVFLWLPTGIGKSICYEILCSRLFSATSTVTVEPAVVVA